MMHESADPGSVTNVWGFMGTALMAASAAFGSLVVWRRDKHTDPPPKAPEREALENAYGLATDGVPDMAIQLIWSVRQELIEEKDRRRGVERRLDTWVGWARDLGQNWHLYRTHDKPPPMPVDVEKEDA